MATSLFFFILKTHKQWIDSNGKRLEPLKFIFRGLIIDSCIWKKYS